jgi:hypothetical protein
VLVTLGAVLLAQRLNDVAAAGGWPLVVGLGFLVWWAFSGKQGLLVPAGVLAGLGLGLVAQKLDVFSSPVALGLGAGFIAIYLLGLLRGGRTQWWPLVPGAVLVAVGLLEGSAGWGALGELGWPLLLIVVGLIVAGGALLRRRPRR